MGLLNIKTIRQIAQTFVAFSEKLNFKIKCFITFEDFLKICIKKEVKIRITSTIVL